MVCGSQNDHAPSTPLLRPTPHSPSGRSRHVGDAPPGRVTVRQPAAAAARTPAVIAATSPGPHTYGGIV
jgi:hypothetical protein